MRGYQLHHPAKEGSELSSSTVKRLCPPSMTLGLGIKPSELILWWPKRDLNSHTRRHRVLNPGRLPIPPFGQYDDCPHSHVTIRLISYRCLPSMRLYLRRSFDLGSGSGTRTHTAFLPPVFETGVATKLHHPAIVAIYHTP